MAIHLPTYKNRYGRHHIIKINLFLEHSLQFLRNQIGQFFGALNHLVALNLEALNLVALYLVALYLFSRCYVLGTETAENAEIYVIS